MNPYLKSFIISLIITAATTPLAIKIAPKIGAMDIPKDGRRVHSTPIPRFGGVVIFLGVAFSFLMLWPLRPQLLGILSAAFLIMLWGMVDDIKGLKPLIKFSGQAVCAIILWAFSLQIRGMANFLPFGPEYISFSTPISLIVTIGWVVTIINCVNLIDGLDGLASGIVLIACLTTAYIAIARNIEETGIIILGIAGACTGFLIFNFNPAKIFMGDSGSMLLGLLLSSVALVGDTPTKGVTLFSLILPMIIMGLPLFDTVFAIVRRTINHKSFLEADKGHLHHRIMAMGFGQRRSVLVLYCISAILGVSGILWTFKEKFESFTLMLIALTLIFIFLGFGIDKDDEIAKKEEAAGIDVGIHHNEVTENKDE